MRMDNIPIGIIDIPILSRLYPQYLTPLYLLLNLYATYARNGTINMLLPFMDLLRNVQPYVAHPAPFSSHLQLQS